LEGVKVYFILRIWTGSLTSRLFILQNERQTSVTEKTGSSSSGKEIFMLGIILIQTQCMGKNLELLNFTAESTHSNHWASKF